MKFKALLSGGGKEAPKGRGKAPKETEDIDTLILRTGTQLNELEKKFTLILNKELARARYNRERGVKNSANYSRIGIAYYSLNAIKSVQERMSEISSSRDLYTTVNSLGRTIGTINGLNKNIGHMDIKGVMSNLKKMTGQSSGASKELISALEKLSGANAGLTDTVPIEALVSSDVIERLISGEDELSEMVESHEGLNQNTDDVMNLINRALEEPPQTQGTAPLTNEPDTEAVLNDISAMIASL